MNSAENEDGLTTGRLIKLMCLLWLAGVAMRMTILAIPPVIPQIHAELHMSETQVGLLVGLPLALFAAAAIPGSLLIARIGVGFAVILGMVIAAFAGAARAAATDVAMLYATSIATGFGVAIMQPGMPTLVRDWLPERVALGTIGYTCGMLVGATLPLALTIPFVLPLAGGSWRIALLFWAIPAFIIPPVFFALSPGRDIPSRAKTAATGKWWPNWRDPVIWLLGLSLGTNNASYFAANAFLGDYLESAGKINLLGTALAWLNGGQIVVPFILLFAANRLQRRVWPFAVFGPILVASFIGIVTAQSEFWIMVWAALIGFTTAVTLTATLALPPLLAAPADVPRTAAGMFTISYTLAIIVPTISGALWDSTGRPWIVFMPLGICAVAMTILGIIVVRFPSADKRPRPEKPAGA
jgi:CP family cyanate transporter-like MFS transporter